MKKSLAFLLGALILAGCSVDNAGSHSSVDKTVAPEKGNVLVAYFSVTNNTEKLALYAQEHLQSDIFEIVPEVEYTSADIDYNSDCRANSEQNDDKARPAIKKRQERHLTI